jgi:hypothetical protein
MNFLLPSMLGCLVLTAAIEAHADETTDGSLPPPPGQIVVAAQPEETGPIVLLHEVGTREVVPVDDQVWREHRRGLKTGLSVGGVLLAVGGGILMGAAINDMKNPNCHDWLGLCQAGDTTLAVFGGVAMAGGGAMLITAVALPSSRQTTETGPRMTLGLGPGSGRLSVAF